MNKIAITSSLSTKDNKINIAYIDAFTNEKTLPIIIPAIVNEITETISEEKHQEYKQKAKEIATIFDALILTGGSDINPLIFQKSNVNSSLCNTKRDQSDLYLTEAFIAEKKPIMGICRGMQFL